MNPFYIVGIVMAFIMGTIIFLIKMQERQMRREGTLEHE
jgi:hypothetical protein